MRVLLVVVLLTVVLTALGCGTGNANVATNSAKKIEKDSDVPRISVGDAKKDVDAGNAVIVDSRASTAYDQEHIAGAINIPFGTKVDIASIPKGKKIIVYCS